MDKKVSFQSHPAGGTEAACSRASYLGGYTKSPFVAIRDQDHLDDRSIGQTQGILGGFIRRGDGINYLRQAEVIVFSKILLEISGEVRHLIRIKHKLLIEPFHELFVAISRELIGEIFFDLPGSDGEDAV